VGLLAVCAASCASGEDSGKSAQREAKRACAIATPGVGTGLTMAENLADARQALSHARKAAKADKAWNKLRRAYAIMELSWKDMVAAAGPEWRFDDPQTPEHQARVKASFDRWGDRAGVAEKTITSQCQQLNET